MKAYRVLLQIVLAAIACFAMIDGLSSAIDFLNIKRSSILTFIVLFIYLVLYFLQQKDSAEKKLIFKGVTPGIKYSIIGTILAFWFPLLLQKEETSTETTLRQDREEAIFDDKPGYKNILLLPYQSLSNDTLLESKLFFELEEKIKLDSLRYRVKFISTYPNQYSFSKMREAGYKYNADIVLSGYKLNNEQMIKYVILDESMAPFEYPNQDTIHRQVFNTLSSLYEGFVPVGLHNILYLSDALDYLKEEDYNLVIRAYDKLIIDEKDKFVFEDVFVKKGACYMEVGKPDSALLHFNKVIEFNPENMDAINNRAILLYYEYGKEAEAINEFNRLITLDKSYPRSYINLASIYLQRGEIEKMDHVLSIGVREIDVFYMPLQDMKDFAFFLTETQTQKDFGLILLKELSKRINDIQVFNNIGREYMKKGESDSAIYYLQKANNMDNNHFQSLANLALVYAKEGAFYKAEEYFKRALQIDSTDSDLHYNLGVIYMDNGKTQLAEKHFNKSIQITPGKKENYVNLAVMLIQNNNFDFAIEYLQEAIRIDDKYERAYLTLVMCHLSKDEIDAAERVFNKLKKNVSPLTVVDSKRMQDLIDGRKKK